VNVRLGAAYLSGLVKEYRGDYFRAVAAYNAGESAVGRWWTLSNGDPAAFLEGINYKETRFYLRRSSSTFSNITGSTVRRCSPVLSQASRRREDSRRCRAAPTARGAGRQRSFDAAHARSRPDRTAAAATVRRNAGRSVASGPAGRSSPPVRLSPAHENDVAPGGHGEDRRLPDAVPERDRLHLQRVGEDAPRNRNRSRSRP